MPEIKLGSSKNAKNINLGSKEIEEVRLGRVLVWQNNIAPQIVLTTPEVGEYGDLDFPIGITVASNVNIIFSAQDLDPLDTIVSYAVDGPTGFTPVPTTPITPGNPVSGLTFTIPNTLFTVAGEPTTNNVFTVTVTDQRGKDGIYTVTVIGVSVPPPTIRVTNGFGTASALTSNGRQKASATWVITQPTETSQAGYTAQYSYDNVNWSTGSIVSRNLEISCGGSQTVRVWCRSVKTGSTTAIGNSAASTFSVSAPLANFPVILNNCVYGTRSITGFTASQTCGGEIKFPGSTNNGFIRLYSETGNFQTSERFTGTSFSNLVEQTPLSVPTISPELKSKSQVRYKVPFKIPNDPFATFSYSCVGGDYRITAISGPGVSRAGVIGAQKGVVGTSKTTGLYDRGPDWKYTRLQSSDQNHLASYTLSNPDFGTTLITINFEQVGYISLLDSTISRSTYSGFFRMADGSTIQSSGRTRGNTYDVIES